MIEFAKSMAGHDRNHIYLVTGKDERFVYLADGNVKLLAEPKKKNRKHIQIIHRLPEPVPHPVMTKSAAPEFNNTAARIPFWT